MHIIQHGKFFMLVNRASFELISKWRWKRMRMLVTCFFHSCRELTEREGEEKMVESWKGSRRPVTFSLHLFQKHLSLRVLSFSPAVDLRYVQMCNIMLLSVLLLQLGFLPFKIKINNTRRMDTLHYMSTISWQQWCGMVACKELVQRDSVKLAAHNKNRKKIEYMDSIRWLFYIFL